MGLIEPGQEFGAELFDYARGLQDLGVEFEYLNHSNCWVRPSDGMAGFHVGCKYRRKPETSTLSQFAGCVLDLQQARHDFNEQREHLNNANENLAQFVGDGDARDIEIHGVTHRVSNVGNSIMIVRD